MRSVGHKKAPPYSYILFIVSIVITSLTLGACSSYRYEFYVLELKIRDNLEIIEMGTATDRRLHDTKPMPIGYELKSEKYIIELNINPELTHAHIIAAAFTPQGDKLLLDVSWQGQCGGFKSLEDWSDIEMPEPKVGFYWRPDIFCSGRRFETIPTGVLFPPLEIEILNDQGGLLGREKISFSIKANGYVKDFVAP